VAVRLGISAPATTLAVVLAYWLFNLVAVVDLS
jgi:hypothetical protein